MIKCFGGPFVIEIRRVGAGGAVGGGAGGWRLAGTARPTMRFFKVTVEMP